MAGDACILLVDVLVWIGHHQRLTHRGYSGFVGLAIEQWYKSCYLGLRAHIALHIADSCLTNLLALVGC